MKWNEKVGNMGFSPSILWHPKLAKIVEFVTIF
jgi:hypothetical protein